MNKEYDFAKSFQQAHENETKNKQLDNERRINTYLQEICQQAPKPESYLLLADLYCKQNDIEQAIKRLHEAVELFPNNIKVYHALAQLLAKAGDNLGALAVYEQAITAMPASIGMRIAYELFLPGFYESEEQIAYYRTRFEQGIGQIEALIDNDDAQQIDAVFNALPSNFPLAYQGYNDVFLQKKFARLISRISQSLYPEWKKEIALEQPGSDEKIRIGYISSNFSNHTVTLIFISWLKHLDQEKFSVFSYHTGSAAESMTELVKQTSNEFYGQFDSFRQVCEQIRADNLQVLVYLDIGMSALTTKLASLNLAPIQCVAWGHPVTTGLDSIDYFLSSELMEPVNGDQHYCENLVKLPNLGISYDKPFIPVPGLTKRRKAFGLSESSTLYLCSQNLLKYLPRHDWVFAEIAEQIENAEFVFFANNKLVGAKFLDRLSPAFKSKNLDVHRYCRVLNYQSTIDFWNINLLSDIFLDSLGWTGFRTTLEAVSMNLPIVTYPGKLMRERQSPAILKLIGITETVAKDENDFVDIAVRLAKDSEWRNKIREKTKINKDKFLYNDLSSIKGLERFYLEMVN